MIGAAVALPAAIAVGFLVRWVGPRVGALDHPDHALKPHGRPVPFLGGIAVAAGLVAGLAAEALGGDGWALMGGLSAVVLGAAAVGLADDAVGLSPVVRLGAQAGLAVLLVTAGELRATALPGRPLAYAGAALLLVAAVNAVNMVDGMDGLAGTLGAISAGGVAVVATLDDRPATLAVVILAAAVGFLVHNLPPARLFLGDNGAYLLGAGLTVAVLATGRTVPALAGAASCLGLFLLDLLLAVLRRAAGRTRLFAGDRSHLYDQLLARGRSVGVTLALCAGLHVALAAAGVAASALSTAGALALCGAVWAVAVGALFGFGFVTARSPAR